MASRQLAWNVTNTSSPESLDDGDRCAAINTVAYQTALAKAPAATRARFQKSGKPMVMVADKKPFPPAGPWWIWNYLKFDEKDTQMEVASWKTFYALGTNPYGAGTHYCKLLSPARAMEWIYTDG
eukprot:Hpha_TRINITY_DN16764_c2_g1::TRINITY_DN16764_c2_g1_i5::g.78103::m.78103